MSEPTNKFPLWINDALPENDTISRIGTSCLQQLLENNAQKLSNAQWDTVVMTFLRLFKGTTPHQLFDESLRAEGEVVPVAGDHGTLFTWIDLVYNSSHLLDHRDNEQSGPLSPLANEAPITGRDRSRIFKDIIMKCVIQLLLIETTNDLLQNKDVYRTIPPDQLLKLMSVLDHSYQFARSFNADKELRTGLWKVGECKSVMQPAVFIIHHPYFRFHEASPQPIEAGIIQRSLLNQRFP